MVSVCDELYSQLQTWHSSIPEPYRPNLDLTRDGDIATRQSILRIRYFAARHIIYRPFALYIATNGTGQATEQMIEKAAICLESCRRYIYCTNVVLQRPSQYTWTFSVSYVSCILKTNSS